MGPSVMTTQGRTTWLLLNVEPDSWSPISARNVRQCLKGLGLSAQDGGAHSSCREYLRRPPAAGQWTGKPPRFIGGRCSRFPRAPEFPPAATACEGLILVRGPKFCGFRTAITRPNEVVIVSGELEFRSGMVAG